MTEAAESVDMLAARIPANISPTAPGKRRCRVMYPQIKSGSWTWPLKRPTASSPANAQKIIRKRLKNMPAIIPKRAAFSFLAALAVCIIGAEAMIRAAPDGHTLLMTTASVTSINMVTYAKPPYDTLRDMLPLSPVMTTASLIVLHPSMPVKNLKEFVAFAKSRPNQIAFGSAGLGGTLHLGLEMLMAEANIKITHVAYKGAAPAVNDVIAGQIQGMFVDLPVISPYVKSGRVRAIAVAAQQRSPHFPDIPSAKEAGFGNVDMLNYYGLLTQAKVPRDIANKLHGAIIKTVNTSAVRDRLLSVGADPLTLSIEEFTDYIRKDIEKWRKVVKGANLTFER